MNDKPHAARYDKSGAVTKVIVGDAEWAAEAIGGGTWVDCGSARPSVGWDYVGGEFRPPAPYVGWLWADRRWVAPVPQPDGTPEGGGCWDWDDDTLEWVFRPAAD
jgi:hypothetical protein